MLKLGMLKLPRVLSTVVDATRPVGVQVRLSSTIDVATGLVDRARVHDGLSSRWASS
jgi:hypothetical protein